MVEEVREAVQPEIDRRSDTERRARELRRLQDEILMEQMELDREDMRKAARRREFQNWILIALVIAAALSGGFEQAATMARELLGQ